MESGRTQDGVVVLAALGDRFGNDVLGPEALRRMLEEVQGKSLPVVDARNGKRKVIGVTVPGTARIVDDGRTLTVEAVIGRPDLPFDVVRWSCEAKVRKE